MADTRDLNPRVVITAINQAGAQLLQVKNQVDGIASAGRRATEVLAGGFLGYRGFRSLIRDTKLAMDMQGAMARAATAMSETGAVKLAHLADVQRRANELMAQGINLNVDSVGAYYIARSANLPHEAALAAMVEGNRLVIATAKNVAEGQAALVPTTRLLADSFNNFGDVTKAVNPQLATMADLFAAIQTGHAFQNITELSDAMHYISPVAHGVGMSLQQSVALAAILSESGLHGATAGTTGAEFIKQLSVGGKLAGFRMVDPLGNLDVGKSLQRLNAVTSAMAPNIRARFLERMGFTGENLVGVELMLGKWKEFNGIVAEGFHSQGVAASKAAERSAAADFQVQILLNRWSRFQEILGASLLGPLNKVLGVLKPAVLVMNEFAETHPRVAQVTAALIGLGSAAVIAGGAVQLLGIGTTFSAIASGVAATAVAGWTAAMWLLDAALLANPIGVAIGLVAAFGFAGYELVKHWSAVAGFFRAMWSDITGIFNSVVGAITGEAAAMYAAGVNLIAQLGRGIEATALAPVHAIQKIAHDIRSYLPFSPAETGPLADLHRVRIVQTVAETMRPGPVIAAMRRVAAAAAITIPIMVTPAMAAMHVSAHVPAMAAPELAITPVLATPRPAIGVGPGQTSAAPVIHNTINVTVNHRGGDDDLEGRVRKGVEEALERSGYKLTQILRRERENTQRTEY